MLNQEITDEQLAEFNILYGSLFALSLASEYLDVLKAVIRSRRSNHTLNKVIASEKANDTLFAVIKREFTKSLSPEEKTVVLKAIEEQRNFTYEIFELDGKGQERVKGLIKRIKKEQAA